MPVKDCWWEEAELGTDMHTLSANSCEQLELPSGKIWAEMLEFPSGKIWAEHMDGPSGTTWDPCTNHSMA
jgi:hypothetical protein